MANSIQIISDIHLEFRDDWKLSDLLTPSAPNLAICGDLGLPYMESYEKFLKECSQNFKQVFIVTGNHEYYQWKHKDNQKWTIDMTNESIQNITAKYSNIHFLNNNYCVLDDKYIIIGTTLWSHVPQKYYSTVIDKINDYKNIYHAANKLISPHVMNNVHNENVQWLKKTIEQFKDKKIIVLSHHLPSDKLIHKKYLGNPINYCFATNLEHIMLDNVYYWFSGHTHSSFDIKINNCRCVVNPKGYCDENPEYDNKLVIDIDK